MSPTTIPRNPSDCSSNPPDSGLPPKRETRHGRAFNCNWERAKSLSLLLCAAALASCASGKWLAPPPSATTSDSATVIIMREHQFTGSGRTVKVLLDAKPIARLGPGKKLEFQVSPGSHFLAVDLPDFLSDNEQLIRFTAEKGKTYYFHYSFHLFSGDVLQLEQLSEDAGRRELSRGHYKLIRR